MKEEKLRYWYVVFIYNTTNGTATAVVGQTGTYLNYEIVSEMYFKNHPEIEKAPIVITNFIEMTKEDYDNFFKS